MHASHPDRPDPHALDRIARALTGLQFGSVEISIHHGRIVQIERREKLRLEEPRPGRTERATDKTSRTS